MNLVEMLYNASVEFGSKESLRYKRTGRYHSLTYSELWQSIQQFASALQTHGVRTDDKVALFATNCPEWVICDYAIQWLGGVVVPIYPTIPAPQVEFILKNADVKVAIVGDQSSLNKLIGVWPEVLRKVILIHGTPQNPGPEILAYDDVMQDGKQTVALLPDFHAIPETKMCTIVHTSGTSGTPKGVMLSHQNLVSNVKGSLSLLPVQRTDISLSYLPLSHIFERTVEEYAMLSSGATVVFAEDIESIQQNLMETKPTILVTVPRLLEKVYSGVQVKINQAPRPIRALLRKGIHDSKSLGLTYRLVDLLVYKKVREGLGGQIRAIVSGGAGLGKEIAEFYMRAGIPIYEGYGMTEAAPVITANPFGASRPGTVGLPIPGLELKTAEDGELWVRGPNVMLGYYGCPQETAETVTEDGWLKTGDIAVVNPDGYVRIVDRKKNILVLATGKNVAPWPIENNIALSPYIAEAVLIGDGRQYVTCLIVPDFAALTSLVQSFGGESDPAVLISHLQVQMFLANEIARAVALFAPFEQPKRAVLVPVKFTLEAGELTPTLKVRNMVILQKYGHLIEDMYNGKAYIPIFAPEESASAAGGGNDPHALKLPRWKKRVLASVLVMLLAAGGIEAATGNVRIPKNLNLIAMIRTIHSNNDKINTVNSKIVGNMQQISDLSGITSNIGQQLHTLNQGVAGNDQSLSDLNNLSQQEVALSTSFVSLANSLHTNLLKISNSSNAQSQSVSTMLSQMNQLSASAAHMTQVNQSIAGKLSTATQETGTIAREMP
ncbi:MAG: hypothetical protein A2201_04620 [Alicyclobacillus sp. RIFOXYA1_FULL_53_8]|nr:MAG: hypothetical protein A2201_04620 [Alicyclobacillus sp. RIFOXYA1_FULL_53_8]